MAVHIITDSTADLGVDLAAQFNISIIPLYVNTNGQTYADGVNIHSPELFEHVRQTGQIPKTSAPTVPDFIKFFSMPGECIYIGLSSQLSATMQNALLAQQNFEPGKVYVIDSLNLSTGIGLLTLAAAEMRDEGLPAAEIYQRINDLVPKVRTSFVIETLEYLYKGGRCSAMQNLMGSLLKIRPVITVRPDGTLGVKDRMRGTRMKALQFLLDDFCNNMEQINMRRVFVTHTCCPQDAEYLRTALQKLAPIENVLVTDAGSVIASHCGPDTIGILYLLN